MGIREKTWFWLVGLTVGVLLLYLLRGVLLPFVAGMAVAYFLDPVCDWLEAHGLGRSTATALVTAVFVIGLVVFLAFAIPLLVGQASGFLDRLPDYVASLREKIDPLLMVVMERLGPEQVAALKQGASGYTGDLVKWAGSVVGDVLLGISAFANIISLLVITPIVTFYLLRDWDRMVEKIDGLLPRGNRDMIHEQAKEVDRTLSGFVRGQVSVCVILGIIYATGLFFVGLDFGIVIGFVTGLVSFIPYFGMLAGFVIGMAVAIAQFHSIGHIALVALVFGIGQMIEGNLLTPKLVGEKVNLHAVWIIFALLAGGALFGFLGVLLAIPVAAVIGVLVRFSIARYLESPFFGAGGPPPGSGRP